MLTCNWIVLISIVFNKKSVETELCLNGLCLIWNGLKLCWPNCVGLNCVRMYCVGVDCIQYKMGFDRIVLEGLC